MSALLVGATGALVILGYAIVRARPLTGDARSIASAVGSGAFAAVGTVVYFALLRRGAGLAAVGPLVLAGTAVVTAVSGYLVFAEKVTLSRVLGMTLAGVGIALLSRK